MLESSTTFVQKNSDCRMQDLIECQQFLEYMPVTIAMFDRQMCYVLSSQRWQDTFGVAGTKGTLLYDRCPGTSEIWQEIQRTCAAGEVTTWEEAVTDPNGIWQWVTWKVQPWYDEAGDVGGAIICAETIADFKQIENLLKQSFQELEDLKLALDHASILTLIDPQGIVTHINDTFCDISQSCREEILGKNYQILTSRYHSPQFFQDLWMTISGGLIWQGEIKNCAKDGTIYWLETTIVPSLDSQGIPYQYIAISHDITEQKQIEQQLQESQQFLQRVLDHIPQQIFWKDRHSVYLGCNQKGAKTAGLNSPAEIIGKVDYDLPWTTAEADWYRDIDRHVMDSGKPRLHMIETQKQADGQVTWLNTHKIPLQNVDGEVVGILVMIEDITDRKQAEERLKSANEDLENRVQKRTIALQSVIAQLEQEMHDRCQTQQQLQKHAQFLQTLWDGVEYGIFILDVLQDGEDYRFVRFNPTLARTSQVPIEKLLGKTLTESFPPEVANVYRQHYQKCLRSGQSVNFEERLEVDFLEKWWLINLTPLKNETGNIHQIVATLTDITDRKVTENALAESEAKFRHLVEGANDLIYSISLEGIFTYVAPQVISILGWHPSEIIGQSIVVFTHPDDLSACLAFNQSVIETGEPRAGMEIRALHKNGSVCWLTCNNSPIKNTQGHLVGIQGIARDISDRKAMEDALTASETKFRYLVENSKDLLYSMNLDGTFTYLSPTSTEMLGYTPSECLGQSFTIFTHPEDLPACITFNKKMLASREKKSGLEVRIQQKQGGWCWVSISQSPMSDVQGNIVGFQGIVHDITDQKSAEFQLKQKALELETTLSDLKQTQAQMLQSEKMSSLGQLVAGIAHEINNPTNFIYGNLSHAHDYSQDLLRLINLYQQHYPHPAQQIQEEVAIIDLEFIREDITKLFFSMRLGAERIREIVLSLRNFSRLDESEFKQANLHEGIESTLMILQSRLKSTPDYPGIQVVKQYGNVPLLECYPGQLNQVFMNLLSNAIDAIEERDRTRELADIWQNPSQIIIHTELSHDQRVRIQIQDNGIGMNSTHQSRIFDPFFTTKEIGKGTGLGMSISYQIITERHSGTISCTSSPGKGATFTIFIPLKQNKG